MATKKTKSIEELLKEAGFTTVTVVNDRVMHASVKDDKTFNDAHAAFVKASCKHHALVGASRLPMAASNDVLVVHYKTEDSEDKAGSKPAVQEKPETQNSEPGTE